MEGIGQHIPTLLAAGLALVSLRIYPYSPSSENSVHHEHAKATITEIEDENDDLDTDNTDGSVKPVVVQWRNISCVLMDKAGEVVCTLRGYGLS